MKFLPLASIFAVLPLGMPLSVGAAPFQGEAGRPATSREQLVARLKQQQEGVAIASPEEQQPRWDLAANSEFITFNGDSTLIPKRAIIHLPEASKKNVVQTATGKVLSWLEFSAKYPALVTRVDVTIKHASGQESLDPKVMESFAKDTRIVVAVLSGSPISVATKPAAPQQ